GAATGTRSRCSRGPSRCSRPGPAPTIRGSGSSRSRRTGSHSTVASGEPGRAAVTLIAMSTFSYPEVGATRDGALPPGYRHLRYRTRLRSDSFRAAGEAVLTWRLHRRVGIPFQTVADRAAPGVRVASGLAWLSAPCEIVWTVDDDGR